MRLGFIIVLLAVLISCGSHDQPDETTLSPIAVNKSVFLGVDWLGATHQSEFDCDLALEVYDGIKAPAFGFLWRTFGDDLTCPYKFMEKFQDRQHLIRIHITNEVCRRRENCSDVELEPGINVVRLNELLEKDEGWLRQKYQKRLGGMVAWIVVHSNPNTHVLLSTGLEDNFTKNAARTVDGYLDEFLLYKTVRNPVNPTNRADTNYIELHHHEGPYPSNCVASLDGADIVFPHKRSSYHTQWSLSKVRDWAFKSRACYAVFLWSARAQGLGLDSGFLEPRQRAFELLPMDISTMNQVLLGVQ